MFNHSQMVSEPPSQETLFSGALTLKNSPIQNKEWLSLFLPSDNHIRREK